MCRLKGQFAELALSPICSYTVEKCFATGDVKLKEMIAAELALSQPEISKTRHGPYLLKRCDISTYGSDLLFLVPIPIVCGIWLVLVIEKCKYAHL